MYHIVEKTNCRVCKTNEEPDIVLIKKAYELSRCKICKVIFASRRLKKELVSNLYINYVPTAFTDMQQDKLKDVGKKKLNDRIDDAKYQLSIINKYIHNGKMLDIGAAAGTFLDVARTAGWDIRGTELSDGSISVAKQYYHINLFKVF